ncbi:hypothetical protein [Thioalkalivibrio thiocyanoxidans]|uniref:hypothetical protein n=1 Tax=Thioalkalivibrio thiocyanoxidans TaxID=152475 RepID=UPI000365F636|nr:hypothetical protein [Thioalkalivibrio thiocyanoxidans]
MTEPALPKHVIERLEIAILTGETLQLNWAEPDSSQAWWGKVTPREVREADGYHWLDGECEGRDVRIRLDLIRNLPTPVK